MVKKVLDICEMCVFKDKGGKFQFSFSKNLLVLSFLVVGFSSLKSQNSLIDLQNSSTEISIENILFLEDLEGKYELNDIVTDNHAGSFSIYKGDPSALNEKNLIFWVKFSVTNISETDREWVFDFGNTWTHVDFYLMDSSYNNV